MIQPAGTELPRLARMQSSCPASRWRLPIGDRPRAPHEHGLGTRWGHSDGAALRALREGHIGIGQSGRAYQGGLLRGDPGDGPNAAHRVVLHADAQQLAEHGKGRTQCDDESVPVRTPVWRFGDIAGRDPAWPNDSSTRQRGVNWRMKNRRRSSQARERPPEHLALKEHWG